MGAPRKYTDGDIEAMIDLHQAGESLALIGDFYGVSRQRIHQLITWYRKRQERTEDGSGPT